MRENYTFTPEATQKHSPFVSGHQKDNDASANRSCVMTARSQDETSTVFHPNDNVLSHTLTHICITLMATSSSM